MSTFTVPQPSSKLPASDSRSRKSDVAAPVETTPAAEPGIGRVLAFGIPLTMLAVFALTVLFVVLGGGPVGEAVGYGAYLAFWIGGGFGAIFSGAYFNHVTGGLAESH